MVIQAWEPLPWAAGYLQTHSEVENVNLAQFLHTPGPLPGSSSAFLLESSLFLLGLPSSYPYFKSQLKRYLLWEAFPDAQFILGQVSSCL